MASKSFKQSRSNLSSSTDASELQQLRPPLPPTVTFARRTSSGRYVNYSRDDLDSELSSSEYADYTVQIPATPDNQPMPDPTISQRVEEQYVSSSLFTGGFNSVTRAHLLDKVIDSEASHPQMAGAKGSSCAVHGCDGNVVSDGRGKDILPCECDFKICRDCYIDAIKSGDSICPGCKEPYKSPDLDEATGGPLPLPPPSDGMSKMERRLSLMKSTKSVLMRSQTAEFDHNRWLYETKGTYGYGNAIWPKEGAPNDVNSNDGDIHDPQELMNKPWRPLTRKLKIPAAVLSPYRYKSNLSVRLSF